MGPDGTSTTIVRQSRSCTVFAAVLKESVPDMSVRSAASTSMKNGSLARPAKTRTPSCSERRSDDELGRHARPT